MNIEWNRSSMTRFAGEALFVSGCLSYDVACANEVSASQAKPSQAKPSAEAEPASSGGSVKELAFSFYDCTPAPQGPHFTVSSDVSDVSDVSDLSDSSDRSDYTVIASAARDFCGWITVTAYAVIRSAVRAFRRIVCEAKALFNRRVLIIQGGLRL